MSRWVVVAAAIVVAVVSCGAAAYTWMRPHTVASIATSALLQQVTDCDLLAAHPDDNERMAEGVADDKIVPRLAIQACTEASSSGATDSRFTFQLGRALLAAGRKSESFEQFKKAADAKYAAAAAYMGDAYQFGTGVKEDQAKAYQAYKNAFDWGFERAKVQLEQLDFDKSLYSAELLDAFFNGRMGPIREAADDALAKWPTRAYIFALTQKFVSECGRILRPASVEKLYAFRYGSAWSTELEGRTDVSIKASVAEVDAESFLRRHGCDGPIARHVFSSMDDFIAARSGD